MQSSWIGWVAFFFLAALIGITSCQAYNGPDDDAQQQETETG
jgi:hypothetical protein